jgi:hypothetical protein
MRHGLHQFTDLGFQIVVRNDQRANGRPQVAAARRDVRASLVPADAFKQLPVWKRDDREPTVCLARIAKKRFVACLLL